jgi:tRNA modification GTPase
MTEPGVPYPDIPTNDDQTVIRIENKTERFQAKYGIGIETLKQQLIAAAPKTSDSDIIITNARHYDALVRAHEAILRVIEGLEMQMSGDLLSEDLRLVLNILAEITGTQITPNEVLGNIFKHFCVGK